MKIILFGATGMVGRAVLRECLADPDVTRVLSVGRQATGERDDKLREIVHRDFLDFSAIEHDLAGYDACFFCLGISSVGMTEADYRRVTFDITTAAARTLIGQNPAMVFIYVTGSGTDSSGSGSVMWARVKGQTENALLQMPFKAAYMFRPAYIHPVHGVASKTAIYRMFYAAIAPLYPVLRAVAPRYVTTTEHIGRAMLRAAKHGAPTRILESPDIEALGSS